MTRILLLAALSLWTSPAHADWQCDGIVTSSGLQRQRAQHGASGHLLRP
jgi:hypothetical protein